MSKLRHLAEVALKLEGESELFDPSASVEAESPRKKRVVSTDATERKNETTESKSSLRICACRECSNPAGQPNKPRSIYCSRWCQSREQNLRQNRIRTKRRGRRPRVLTSSESADSSSRRQHVARSTVSQPSSPSMRRLELKVKGQRRNDGEGESLRMGPPRRLRMSRSYDVDPMIKHVNDDGIQSPLSSQEPLVFPVGHWNLGHRQSPGTATITVTGVHPIQTSQSAAATPYLDTLLAPLSLVAVPSRDSGSATPDTTHVSGSSTVTSPYSYPAGPSLGVPVTAAVSPQHLPAAQAYSGVGAGGLYLEESRLVSPLSFPQQQQPRYPYYFQPYAPAPPRTSILPNPNGSSSLPQSRPGSPRALNVGGARVFVQQQLQEVGAASASGMVMANTAPSPRVVAPPHPQQPVLTTSPTAPLGPVPAPATLQHLHATAPESQGQGHTTVLGIDGTKWRLH